MSPITELGRILLRYLAKAAMWKRLLNMPENTEVSVEIKKFHTISASLTAAGCSSL
jgi:hypothetical protein